jgi:uncharacterized membrane protein YbhN (UPF0104 family)
VAREVSALNPAGRKARSTTRGRRQALPESRWRRELSYPDVPDGLFARDSFDPGWNVVRVRSGKASRQAGAGRTLVLAHPRWADRERGMIIKPVRAAVLADDVFRGSRLFGIGELVRWPSRRQALGAGGGLLILALTMLAARRFAETSWPLVHGHPGVLAAAGLLFLLASALKIYAWRALFSADERPRTLALAAGSGGASVVSVALPSRLGDAARVAIVRRSKGCPASVRALCLSLVMLGLVDTAALAPLALASATLPGHSVGMRVGMAVVAGVGIATAALVVALPALAGTRRLLSFRLGRWLRPRMISLRDASGAWAFACAHWLLRALALVLLLGTLGAGFSITLAMVFLCAGAAVGALPIAPAGAATQAGAGAAGLVASGVGTSQAIEVAVAGQTLGALAGIAMLVFCLVRHVKTRAPCRPLGERPPSRSILAP